MLKNGSSKKQHFFGNLWIFGTFDVDLGRFWEPKRVPGGYFFEIFDKKRCFSIWVEFSHVFWDKMRKNRRRLKKRDSLKTIVLPRENDDFQGSLPVQKRYAGFLIHIFCYHKTYPKFFENQRFFDKKSI